MMSKKLAFLIAAFALGISSCNRPYQGSQNTSSAPAPTDIFEGNRLPNEFNVDNLKTGTALARAIASGEVSVTPTPHGITTTPGVLITFTPPIGPTSTSTVAAVCTAPACGAGQSLVCPSGNCPNACGLVCSGVTSAVSSSTPIPVGFRPATYTLHEGEFPYCIARRFDVDPNELLRASGLADGVIYPAGTVLKVPQTGFFPGPRALIPHPATYTVTSPGETFYSIACQYGDPYPEQIAQVNNLPVTAALTVGQRISIP